MHSSVYEQLYYCLYVPIKCFRQRYYSIFSSKTVRFYSPILVLQFNGIKKKSLAITTLCTTQK